MTGDSWSLILYNLYIFSGSKIVPIIFCIGLLLIGKYFMLNLLLAVVMESYMESEQREAQKLKEELEGEQKELEARLKEDEENNILEDQNESVTTPINLLAAKLKPIDNGSNKIASLSER
jgi:hypothetical protein